MPPSPDGSPSPGFRQAQPQHTFADGVVLAERLITKGYEMGLGPPARPTPFEALMNGLRGLPPDLLASGAKSLFEMARQSFGERPEAQSDRDMAMQPWMDEGDGVWSRTSVAGAWSVQVRPHLHQTMREGELTSATFYSVVVDNRLELVDPGILSGLAFPLGAVDLLADALAVVDRRLTRIGCALGEAGAPGVEPPGVSDECEEPPPSPAPPLFVLEDPDMMRLGPWMTGAGRRAGHRFVLRAHPDRTWKLLIVQHSVGGFNLFIPTILRDSGDLPEERVIEEFALFTKDNEGWRTVQTRVDAWLASWHIQLDAQLDVQPAPAAPPDPTGGPAADLGE